MIIEWFQSLGEIIQSYILTHGSVILIGLLILCTLQIGKKVSIRMIMQYLETKRRPAGQMKMAKLVISYSFNFTILVYILNMLSGSLAALGITTAFITMILGWSLQRPVTGMAAWLMVMIKHPFTIGDRIIIQGIRGDVVDISLTHILLNEVGGTIGGEEQSNRGILIPNAVLFDQTVTNYTLDSPYIMDEVVVRITYKSDWDTAERILISAAKQITPQVIQNTGVEPSIRADFFDAGVHMRLRYKTPSTDRQRVSSEIVKLVFKEFNRTDKVEFCYPHSEVLYRYKGDHGEISVPMDKSAS